MKKSNFIYQSEHRTFIGSLFNFSCFKKVQAELTPWQYGLHRYGGRADNRGARKGIKAHAHSHTRSHSSKTSKMDWFPIQKWKYIRYLGWKHTIVWWISSGCLEKFFFLQLSPFSLIIVMASLERVQSESVHYNFPYPSAGYSAEGPSVLDPISFVGVPRWPVPSHVKKLQPFLRVF